VLLFCEQVDDPSAASGPAAEEPSKPAEEPEKHKTVAKHEEVTDDADAAADDDGEDAQNAAPAKAAKSSNTKGYKTIEGPNPANDYQKSWDNDDDDGEYPPYSKMTSPPGAYLQC
jgi:hypothetical protein